MAALFRFYRYDFGPDAISYMTIARHYSLGHWAEAVNVSWSPVFSWLLAPLMAVGIPVLVASQILCFLSGLLALYATVLLADQFGLTGRYRTSTLYIGAWMLVAFALLRNGPDLLEAAILLFYFRIIFSREYPKKPGAGFWCGVLGAAAFLTKAYGFYFFLLNFSLLSLLHWMRSDGQIRRRVFTQYAAGLAAFVVLSGPWIAVVSIRSGKPSMGSTGSWNYRLVGPESPGYPQYFNLIPPPRVHAISMWEEQPPDLLPSWKAWDSPRAAVHQLRVLSNNLKDLREILADTSLLSFAILLGALIFAVMAGKAGISWTFPLVTAATYTCGYLLVIIQDRYIWSILLIVLLLGAGLVQRWSDSLPAVLARRVLIAVFCLSFASLPLRMLIAHRNAGRVIYTLAESARTRYGLEGRLASCGEWNDSDAFAFHLGLPYYGSTAASAEEQNVSRTLNPSLRELPRDAQQRGVADLQLARHEIDYYLEWKSCRAIPDSVRSRPEITGGSLEGLKIYQLRTPRPGQSQ